MAARVPRLVRRGVTTVAIAGDDEGRPWFQAVCDCGRTSDVEPTLVGVQRWSATHRGMDLDADVDDVCADLRSVFELNREFRRITKGAA